jgi:hypothetical protein
MLNHGIHGRTGYAHLLKRNGKTYSVFAGHLEQPRLLDRLCGACAHGHGWPKGCGRQVVGIAGGPFADMGDFQVPCGDLRSGLA